VKEIGFDFWLDRDSFLSVIFNKQEKAYSGILISINPQIDSFYFLASDLGEFLEKSKITPPKFRKRSWQNLKVKFKEDTVSVFLNENNLGEFKGEFSGKGQIGFRGGSEKVLVDNVMLLQSNGTLIRESFSGPKDAAFLTFWIFLVVIGLNGLVVSILRIRSKLGWKLVGFTTVMINGVFVVICTLFFGYQYYFGNYYPAENENLTLGEEYWRNSKAEDILKHIKSTFSATPHPNSFRILFLGSSQTWGAGASSESNTFIHLFEKNLNESNIPQVHFECINAGFSSAKSSFILNLYKRELLTLEPRIVVINLSNNDQKIDWFARNLEEMIEISLVNHIQPILILEPNSVEHNDSTLFVKHEVMRNVGTSKNVPVIDMHSHLRQMNEKGFLWWDFVHLTDFGQKLFAEKLLEDLRPFLSK